MARGRPGTLPISRKTKAGAALAGIAAAAAANGAGELALLEPPEPHAVLDNDGRRSPEQMVDELLAALALSGSPRA